MDKNRGGVSAVGGSTETVSDEFSRPANTTAYAANDRVSADTNDSDTTALRSLEVGRIHGGTGYMTKFRVWTDKASVTPRLRLHFFTVSEPATAVPGDNASFPVMWANRAQRIGTVDLAAMTTPAGTGTDVSIAQDFSTRLPFQCEDDDTKVYYAIETLDAFTPNSGQSFYVEVAAEQN